MVAKQARVMSHGIKEKGQCNLQRDSNETCHNTQIMYFGSYSL